MKNKFHQYLKYLKNHKILTISLLVNIVIIIFLLSNHCEVILPGVISGLVTFIALYITIQSEKEERQQDRRLQIYPYLNYEIIDNVKNIQSDSSIKLFADNNGYRGILDSGYRSSFTGERYLKIRFALMFENAGINDAISLSVLEVGALRTGELSTREIGNIKVGDKKYLELDITIDSIDNNINFLENFHYETIDIKVAYTNITGDYYEQNIKVNLYRISTQSGFPEYEYKAEINMDGVSKPLFFKNKSILTEHQKKMDNFFNLNKKN